MKNIYPERIMDHYHSSRNRGSLADPTFSVDRTNSSCGDRIVFQGIIEDDTVVQALFEGSGCILSQVVASLLADHVRGMGCKEALTLGPGLMRQLIGMGIGPTRMQCVLLALEALQEGIKEAVSC